MEIKGTQAILIILSLAVAPVARGDRQPEAEFHMARMVYGAADATWGFRPWWAIDYPAAEYHFTRGLARLTGIDIAGDSRHLRVTDPELFDYPWLFAQQVGHWRLTDQEVMRLREYVLRGGFLVVDDFHGAGDWETFTRTMDRVFPGRPIVEIPIHHPLMNVVFDLDQSTQIPGRRHLYRAPGGAIAAQLQGPPRWLGLYDERGRLVVAINHNMDMGDAWEHADDPVYPIPMTSLAYRFAVNYVIYAMTH